MTVLWNIHDHDSALLKQSNIFFCVQLINYVVCKKVVIDILVDLPAENVEEQEINHDSLESDITMISEDSLEQDIHMDSFEVIPEEEEDVEFLSDITVISESQGDY